MFSWTWLRDNHSNVRMHPGPRDIETLEDMEDWTVGQYIDLVHPPVVDERKPKKNTLPYPILYGKDMPVPTTWRTYINRRINPSVSYKTGDDILGEIPKSVQIDTNMMYIGYHGTQTPTHCDRMSTFGQNLIVYSDVPCDTSCVWFIASSSDSHKVEHYFPQCNQDACLHDDNFFASIDCLSRAPYDVFVINQKEGDLVLIPPRGAHQAINRGPGISIKFAWSRLPVYHVQHVYEQVMPLYREVGRSEVYRILASCWFGLCNRIKDFDEVQSALDKDKLISEIKILRRVIQSNMNKERVVDDCTIHQFDDDVAFTRYCDLCNADIFNRCLHRVQQADEEDVCLDCAIQNELINVKDYQVYETIPRKEMVRIIERADDVLRQLNDRIIDS
ncbi:jmjd-2 [Acrasis kona]|uniref:Jmjd-2 n=1 Tax=Acrasis kona TaxID=1008807 RepID=A0AAW2YTN6_9EUKA